MATVTHPVLGEVKVPAIVPRLSETPGEIEWLGRGLGEDTDAVLASALGYTRAHVGELQAYGII